jgi:hypothetical protein
VLGVAVAYSLAQYVNVAHAAYRVRSVAGSPWRGMGGFALKLTLASGLSALAMLPAERWLGLDHSNSRLVEVAGLVGVGAIGLAALGAALGLLFFKQVRRRGLGTKVLLRSSQQSETKVGAPDEAQREGV